jgi:predicted hydrolase (HD superfamily)
MTRAQAHKLLLAHMTQPNLIRHCLAVEAVMKALAVRLNHDLSETAIKEVEEKWGVVGLLHDGDYEETKLTPEKHTLKMAEWLKKEGETDKEILEAILSHNFSHTGQNPPKNKLEWALYCCDELTGFIVAVTLVRPDKKISSVTVESVEKKWREKGFAAAVKRQQIEECEGRLGIPLREFIQIALTAMQGISEDLGL